MKTAPAPREGTRSRAGRGLAAGAASGVPGNSEPLDTLPKGVRRLLRGWTRADSSPQPLRPSTNTAHQQEGFVTPDAPHPEHRCGEKPSAELTLLPREGPWRKPGSDGAG